MLGRTMKGGGEGSGEAGDEGRGAGGAGGNMIMRMTCLRKYGKSLVLN